PQFNSIQGSPTNPREGSEIPQLRRRGCAAVSRRIYSRSRPPQLAASFIGRLGPTLREPPVSPDLGDDRERPSSLPNPCPVSESGRAGRAPCQNQTNHYPNAPK